MITQSPVKVWRNQKKLIKYLDKKGTIISFTVIRVPPFGFEAQAPYPVALVSFGKERLIGQLVDCQTVDIKVGMKVRTVLRRIKEADKEGVIPYGIKFKLV